MGAPDPLKVLASAVLENVLVADSERRAELEHIAAHGLELELDATEPDEAPAPSDPTGQEVDPT